MSYRELEVCNYLLRLLYDCLDIGYDIHDLDMVLNTLQDIEKIKKERRCIINKIFP